MPKEEKKIAEKLFTHVSRSRTAGSISPVQCESFEISKRRFCLEGCAESKRLSEGLFSGTLTPYLVAWWSPCWFPKAHVMAEVTAAPFG